MIQLSYSCIYTKIAQETTNKKFLLKTPLRNKAGKDNLKQRFWEKQNLTQKIIPIIMVFSFNFSIFVSDE